MMMMLEGVEGHRCSHPVFREMCQAVLPVCSQTKAWNFKCETFRSVIPVNSCPRNMPENFMVVFFV